MVLRGKERMRRMRRWYAALACLVFVCCFSAGRVRAAEPCQLKCVLTEPSSEETLAEETQKPELGKTEYTMTLTPAQQEKGSRVTYSILEQKQEGEYLVMMDRVEITPDKNGILHLERDPSVVTLKTPGEIIPWPVKVTESTEKIRNYLMLHTSLHGSGLYNQIYEPSETIEMDLRLEENLRTAGIRLNTEDLTFFNLSYSSISYENQLIIPTWNNNGNLTSMEQWKVSGRLCGQTQNLEGSFAFAKCPVSELLGDFYYVVTVENEDGSFVTEPVKISPKRGDELVNVETHMGQFVFRLYWNYAILCSYQGTDEVVEIPGRVLDTPVTEIAPYAFSNMDSEEKGVVTASTVILPSNVKKIGTGAFQGCYGLQEVDLPNSVETIGARAFANCPSLTEITLPKHLRTIGAYAFAGCGALKKVAIPGSVKTVEEGVFAHCGALEEISLSGSSAYKVEDGALYSKDGKSLIAIPAAMEGSFEIAKKTKHIAAECFSDSCLSKVILPEELETIGNYAFYGAKNLKTQELPISAKITYIGTGAFEGLAGNGFSVAEDNGLYLVKEGALLGKGGDELICYKTNELHVLRVPEGVKELNLSLLGDSGAPCHVYVPDGATEIKGRLPQGLTVIIHCKEGSKAQKCAESMSLAVRHDMDPVLRECHVKTKKGELTYHLTATRAILTHYEGDDEELEIPDKVEGLPVKDIGDGMESIMGTFAAKTLHKMVLPDSVEVIHAHAFENFGDFEVNLPEGLKVLEDQALLHCNTRIEKLPEGLEKLGAFALGQGCEFGQGLDLPEGLSLIAPGAFCGVTVSEYRVAPGNDHFSARDGMLFSHDGTKLIAAKTVKEGEETVIPEGTKVIGGYAFYEMPVRTVVIPASVNTIEEYAFAYCSALGQITLEEGLQRIGNHAFAYVGIEELSLPQSCKRVDALAFFGASELKALSGAPETIGDYAFAYCSSLAEAKLNEGTLEIGAYAFYKTAITQLRLPDSLCILGEGAFATDRVPARSVVMHEFYIGKNLKEIGKNAISCLPISDFQINEENASFALVERMLTDRAGKSIIACPSGVSGTVMVPEGIREIGDYAFFGADNVTDVYLPGSVGRIGKGAFYDHSDAPDEWPNARAKLHFLSGTAAHKYAVRYRWPFALTDKDEDGIM